MSAMESSILKDFEKLLDAKILPLVDVYQQLIAQNIALSDQLATLTLEKNRGGSTKGSTSSTVKTNKTSNVRAVGVVIDKDDDGVISVVGKTFDVKEIIKAEPLNGRWNSAITGWTLDEQATIQDVKDALGDKCSLIIKCAST